MEENREMERIRKMSEPSRKLELMDELNYVIQNKDELKKLYGNDVVAVKGTDVVAYGKNRTDVLKQAANKIGNVPFLLGTIDDLFKSLSEPLDIPTPFLDRGS
ncbi:hypothetical protein JXB27_03915 [Candidatus Woesearchaeota archaeon]|nr:hypothetical protein [Candidatus Woesearchaeota archaeon]